MINESMSLQQPDKELEILQNIYRNDVVRQRDLALIVGLSLGMTNAIIKRLATKGFLTVRKVNNRNIMYAVSPAGVEEIAKRSYKYFKRTIKNIVYYKDSVERFILNVKRTGYAEIVLVGESDVDFIVEHLCHKHGLAFVRGKDTAEGKKDRFVLFSENVPEDSKKAYVALGRKDLRDVLIPDQGKRNG